MRFSSLLLASVFSFGMVHGAFAAEINEAGAQSLKNNLLQIVPQDKRKDIPLTVKPAGDHYEAIYDLPKAIYETLSSPMLIVQGLKPISVFIKPLDNGLWSANSNFSMNGTFENKKADNESKGTYAIGSVIFDGLFDPAIQYLRTSVLDISDVKMSADHKNGTVKLGLDALHLQSNLTKTSDPQLDDATFKGSASNLLLDGQKTTENVKIQVSGLDLDGDVKGIRSQGLHEIIAFAVEHGDQKELSAEKKEELKALLVKNWPLFKSFQETAKANNISIVSQVGETSIKGMHYDTAFDGPNNAAYLRYGFGFEGVTVNSPLMPAQYTALVPQFLNSRVKVSEIDMDGFLKEITKDDPKGSEKNAEDNGKILFKNGVLNLDIENFAVRSDIYDLELSGTLNGSLEKDSKPVLTFSVWMRDFDKTVAVIQELGKTEPKLNSVSLGLLTAKGFAKTDPDGRQRWDIVMDEKQNFTINGQPMKF